MKNFIFRSILPTFLTILLFVWAIFFFTLPALEKSVLDQKREMIRELTNSAWNILANFEHDERTGVMTREQAQKLAIESVRNLHYGQGMKDYFWINDMQPRMIIHPYRTDLNGKDLSAIEDSSGNRIFVKFVDLVKRSGAGYVEYLWQWKDDATRISPKLSYVKGFEPWGWIIGTGVYLNDVRQEIASIRNYLLVISTLILVLASSLLAFLVAGSYQTEKQRERAEASLRASEEKYRLLVESAGEYMIMSLGGQKLFANCSMLGLLGYSAEEFARLDISQVVEMSVAEIEKGRSFPIAMMSGELSPIQYESYLIGKNGVRHHVMISLSSIPQGDMPGFLMIASELTSQQERVIRQDRLLEELQQSLLYFHQRVTDMDTLPAVICPETASLEEIGRHFENDAVTAVLIGNDAGSVKGVLMLSAFLRQLFTAGSAAPTTTLTGQLESAIIVDEDCLLFDVFLQYEPPIGVFGNFIVENKRHKTDVLDIKSVMNLVVDFARIYALKHGLKERNTHERLKALREAGVFSDQSYYELKIALSYLMRIRLDKQAVSIDQGLSPDNFVSPDLLTSIDQKILKEIFVQIKNFQVRLSYDFTGMMSN